MTLSATLRPVVRLLVEAPSFLSAVRLLVKAPLSSASFCCMSLFASSASPSQPITYHARTNLMPSNSHNHMPVSRSPLLVLPAVDFGVDLLSTLPYVFSVVLSSTLSTPLSVSRSADSASLVVPPTMLFC
ncbi:hypothetical protein Sjap_004194 [Stephania japonica]|uniref:Uncharacterized protein n=1 Tax=Stephania japonica TaxID=461633 RepID=A0AAP0K242_9MAGN